MKERKENPLYPDKDWKEHGRVLMSGGKVFAELAGFRNEDGSFTSVEEYDLEKEKEG